MRRAGSKPSIGRNPACRCATCRPRTWTNEYVRNGTQALLAALDVATGRVIGHVKHRRTSVNFLRFMGEVVAAFPQRDLHVVLDNLNIHKNPAARRWLKRHPRVHFHHTPTHASWVNLIEVFFSILGLSNRVDKSKVSLRAFLVQYLDQYNQTSAPFTWTKGPEKLQRISTPRRRRTTMANSPSGGGNGRVGVQ
jgi:transposase